MGQPPDHRRVRVAATPHFQRRAKKLGRVEQQALVRALRLFQQNPNDPRLDTHKLRGQHEEKWAFSFGYDARVVFAWEGASAVLLDVGTHDEVYG